MKEKKRRENTKCFLSRHNFLTQNSDMKHEKIACQKKAGKKMKILLPNEYNQSEKDFSIVEQCFLAATIFSLLSMLYFLHYPRKCKNNESKKALAWYQNNVETHVKAMQKTRQNNTISYSFKFSHHFFNWI